MIPTKLYIEAVFYDAFHDRLIEGRLYIHDIDLKWHQLEDKNLYDLKDIRFSGRATIFIQGLILLGSL